MFILIKKIRIGDYLTIQMQKKKLNNKTVKKNKKHVRYLLT